MTKTYHVIGEGSYGCAIKPSLPCSNKRMTYKNKLSKVMTSKNAMKELKEYENISNIDKKQQYFLGVPTLCRVKKTKKTIKAIEKCKNLKSYLKKSVKESMNKLDLLVMNDGGINLKMLSNKIDAMKLTDANTVKVRKIWRHMMTLFNGIIAFQKHDFLHHDLKPQNIVYNKHGVRFIDFGHMRNITMEKKKSENSDNWMHDIPFWNYPLEIDCLNMNKFMDFAMKTDKEKDEYFMGIIDDLNDNNENHPFISAFNGFLNHIMYDRNDSEKNTIRNKYLMAYHKMLMEQIKTENYELFLDKSIKTIDVYGLGMTLYYLLNCSRKFLKRETIEQMESCFYGMTTPNLFERYTIIESKMEFQKIMTGI